MFNEVVKNETCNAKWHLMNIPENVRPNENPNYLPT